MKKLKDKIIRRTLFYFNRCDFKVEHGLPQYHFLKKHGMVWIDYDKYYYYLAYIDENGNYKKGIRKVKHYSQRCLFRHTYSDICKHRLKKHHEDIR